MLLVAGIGVAVAALVALVAGTRPRVEQQPPPPQPDPAQGGVTGPNPAMQLEAGGGGGANPALAIAGTAAGLVTTGLGVTKAVIGIVGAGGAATGAATASTGAGTAAAVGTASLGGAVKGGAGASGGAGAALGATAGAGAGSVGAAAVPFAIVIVATIILLTCYYFQDKADTWNNHTLAMRKRFRGALYRFENYWNEEWLKKTGKPFTRESVTHAVYDHNSLIQGYSPRVQTWSAPPPAAVGQRLSGKFLALAGAPPNALLADEWQHVTAVHRYLAIEQLRGFNEAIYAWYTWRKHDLNYGGGLALDGAGFEAFIREWCELEPYAPELGYRVGLSWQQILDLAQRTPELLDAAKWARARGTARAIWLAAKEGFGNHLNPGDTAYTLTIKNGCGLTDWIYLGHDEIHHPTLPMSVAVVKSREGGGPVIYDRREASQVPPEQIAQWSLSQARRIANNGG